MSEALINQITLNCLMNKKQYEKYVANQVSKSVNEEEKKFYRKRIYCLTKELLLSKEEPPNLLPDVKYAFDNYIKSCIHFFKVSDSNDILQQEYACIQEDKIQPENEETGENEETEETGENEETEETGENEDNEDNNDTGENEEIEEIEETNKNKIDKTFMRTIKTFNGCLDSFVTVTSTKKINDIILPKQREVNLSDPSLMNKGVFPSEKKKNISNL